MRRTWGTASARACALGLAALAATACTPRSRSKPPEAPEIVQTPAITPTPWWTEGAAACPSKELPPAPGGPPGSGHRPGELVGGPPPAPRVWCRVAGVDHGPSTTFHPTGNPAEAGVIDDGFRVGAWTTWHGAGPMASHGHYDNDKLVGVWQTWWPSGGPRDRGEWAGDARRGMWLLWDDGARHGDSPDRFVEYDDHGKLRARGVFRDGQPVETLDVCLIGQSYPGCRLVPVLDTTLREALARPSPPEGRDAASMVFEGGLILNVSDRHGLGFSAGMHAGDDYARRVVRARYRLWFWRHFALELSVGRLYAHDDRPAGTTGRGRVVGVTVLGGEILGVIAEAQDDGGETSVHVGVRVGLPTVLAALYVAAHLGK